VADVASVAAEPLPSSAVKARATLEAEEESIFALRFSK